LAAFAVCRDDDDGSSDAKLSERSMSLASATGGSSLGKDHKEQRPISYHAAMTKAVIGFSNSWHKK
jgi:hypothetical protein